MGQHKHNPTCQLAKEGKLEPKKSPMSKNEHKRFLQLMIYQKIMKETGVPLQLLNGPYSNFK